MQDARPALVQVKCEEGVEQEPMSRLNDQPANHNQCNKNDKKCSQLG